MPLKKIFRTVITIRINIFHIVNNGGMNEYCFSITNKYAKYGIADGLNKFFDGFIPVIICIGTDASIGDSLGPIVGSRLIKNTKNLFVYGTLNAPMTAREISSIKNFVKEVHPLAKTLVIDAAVGNEEDVGVMKVIDEGIMPGLGADKNLPMLGDVSIMGIVAKKSKNNNAFINLTRLSFVYKMAEIIADGILEYVENSLQKPAYEQVSGVLSKI